MKKEWQWIKNTYVFGNEKIKVFWAVYIIAEKTA